MRDAHLPAYKKAGFPVIAIADLDRSKAENLAIAFGIPAVLSGVFLRDALASARAKRQGNDRHIASSCSVKARNLRVSLLLVDSMIVCDSTGCFEECGINRLVGRSVPDRRSVRRSLRGH